MKQIPVYIVWEYDDGIVPNKDIVGIYISYDEANKVKKKCWNAHPEYEYAVETTSLWGYKK